MMVLKQVSLVGIISILLLSESVAARPRQFSSLIKQGWGEAFIAQQPATSEQDATSAAAKRAFQAGEQLYQQGTEESLRQALVKFQEALPLYQTLDDKAQQAETLGYIGLIYDTLGEKQKALEFNRESLALFREIGDKSAEAILLNNIAKVYSDLGDNQEAIAYYNQALALARSIDNQDLELSIIIDLSSVYLSLGEKQQTIELLNQALQLGRTLADKTEQINIIQYVANTYYRLGENQTALEYYNQALSLQHTAGDQLGEANTLFVIGSIYQNSEERIERQRAIDYYQQALALYRDSGNLDRAAHLLIHLTQIYLSLEDTKNAANAYSTFSSLLAERATQSEGQEQQTLQIYQANFLRTIGDVFVNFGYRQKGLEIYQQALLIFQTVEKVAQGELLKAANSGVSLVLNNIGTVYDSIGDRQQALNYYNQALPLIQAVGDKTGEATTLNNIGLVYDNIGQRQQALNYYNQALPLMQAVGDKRGEATTLNNIGLVYSNIGQMQQALDYYNQALSLRRALEDHEGEAATLTSIGAVYYALGERQKALDYYNQALPLSRAVGDKVGEAVILNNIGAVYDNLGERQQALDYYNQALPLRRATGDKPGEAAALNNIGNLYNNLGERQQALKYLNQALLLTREVGDKTGEATTLNNIALVYDALGERQQALDYYNQALPLRRATGDKSGEALTLSGIGLLYYALGEPDQALDYYNQALPLSRAVGDKSGEAVTLNNIGAVYDNLGDKQQALNYYNQALPLMRAAGEKAIEATALNNIGIIYNSLGERQQALDYYNQALPLTRTVGDKTGEALTLNNIGVVYNNLGNKQQALDYYNQALPLSRAVGDKTGEALTLYNFAVLQRDLGNLTESFTSIETAIAIVENLRTKIGSQELRASYFATVQNYYEFYIKLLMQLHQKNPSQGYDAQALHASERARARSLIELLSEASADIRQGVDPKLLEQERIFQQQLNDLDHRKYELLSTQYSQTELDDIQQKIDTVLTQLKQLQAEIRVASPRYADLKYPEPLTLQQIQQQVLDENTVLLEYALGEEASYLWAVTKNSITSYQLPKGSEIKAATQTFRESLTPESGANLAAGLPLSQMLLAPVANQLGNKRLLIVGDGALQYVPFAALPIPSSPTTPLLVQNEIITLPSASTVAIQRRQLQNRSPATKKLAVIADPIFNINDSRIPGTPPQSTPETTKNYALTRATRNLGLGDNARVLDRLQYTRTEAEKILALVPTNQSLEALDFNASRTTATKPDLAQYQIIHLATHGLLDPVNPELSGIVLSLYDQKGQSQDGFLRLHDIFNLNLPAELVVLSACETGLGKDVKGEGLVGLTRGFMYAGARRVVVSLWSVNDVATSEVMAKFYQKMLQEGENPVSALRAAQLEMWHSGQWQSPYYWAAFTVQGDWR